jgi:hypothetical protein
VFNKDLVDSGQLIHSLCFVDKNKNFTILVEAEYFRTFHGLLKAPTE